jgi:hemerythrin-like domain-containing protein
VAQVDLEPTLAAFFTAQHREADGLWPEVERAAQGGDAAATCDAFMRFDVSVRQHLSLEEELLFPEFEAATGIVHGPTTMMRAEHRQMRALLDDMRAALERRDLEAMLDTADTLLTLNAQHNMKEEGMLYRMSEQALHEAWPSLLQRARAQ